MLVSLIARCRLFLQTKLASFRPAFHTMKLKDEQSMFPLLQLTTSSPATHDMALKESVPVLPKIECRSQCSSTGSSSYRGKYSGSCPRGLSTNSRRTGSFLFLISILALSCSSSFISSYYFSRSNSLSCSLFISCSLLKLR